MKTILKTDGKTVSFVIADLNPEYHEAARALFYLPGEEGFAKSYPADTPGIEIIYQQFARHAEEMILQAAGAQPVPWEKSLSDFLQRVEGKGIRWWLTGSAALSVRGIDIVPHDLDLVVEDCEACALGGILQNSLVEPVVPTPGWIANWFGRAFLHSCLEWVGVDLSNPFHHDVSVAGELELVRWQGVDIRVPPLEVSLRVNEQRGRTDRVEKIRRYMS